MALYETFVLRTSLSAEKWLTDTCKPLFLFNIPKNIPFFGVRGGKNPVFRITKKYVPLNR